MQTQNFKIIVAGEGGVGKTSLLHKYVSGTFTVDTRLTIGVEFHLKTVSIDGRVCSLHLWDLGGQERFRFMLPSYVIGAKGALLLYDTTRVSTLESLEDWANICRINEKNLPILLCGTKVDRIDERAVPIELAMSYHNSLKTFDYLEVSAKTGQNVEKVFETLLNNMIKIGGI